MSQDAIHALVESFLFSSDKPLTLDQIKGALDNYSQADIRKILEELKLQYEQANRGMRIVEIAGGFQMVTSPEFSSFIRKLFKEKRAERLSKPALETLAIIAYKQPLTKLEIELLRKVNVDGVMSSLLEKNLIRIVGRKKAPGRPRVYGTSRRFLEYFGLKSLEDLPKIDLTQQAGIENTPSQKEVDSEPESASKENRQPG